MEIKFLTKKVELGEMSFKVGIDRDIACDAFQEFPDLIEYLMSKKADIVAKDDDDFFFKALKQKQLKEIMGIEDKVTDLVGYALPLMLKKAKDNSDAEEIMEYARDNGVLKIFTKGMVDFIFEGFSLGELGTPKIKFSMK